MFSCYLLTKWLSLLKYHFSQILGYCLPYPCWAPSSYWIYHISLEIYLFIVICYIEVGNVGELGVDGGTKREGFEPTKAYIAVPMLDLEPLVHLSYIIFGL